MSGLRSLSMGLVAAALGTGAVVLPAMAGSETTPSILAVNGPGIYQHSWSPSHATVVPGGSVDLSNPTAVPHGVEWVHGPGTPVCSGGVPVGTTSSASGTQWNGTCTFPAAGVYTFYCTVHGPAMSGTITVGPGEPTTGTSTPAGTPPPGQTGTGTGYTPPPQLPGPPPGGPGPQSLLAGPATASVRVLPVVRGRALSGSLDLSAAAAGSTLRLEVLAARTALAMGGARPVRVGHLQLTGLAAGPVRFRVRLSAAALRTLHLHGRLGVRLIATLSSPAGERLDISRAIRLRR